MWIKKSKFEKLRRKVEELEFRINNQPKFKIGDKINGFLITDLSVHSFYSFDYVNTVFDYVYTVFDGEYSKEMYEDTLLKIKIK